jgi:hypothetical protein
LREGSLWFAVRAAGPPIWTTLVGAGPICLEPYSCCDHSGAGAAGSAFGTCAGNGALHEGALDFQLAPLPAMRACSADFSQNPGL